MVVFFVCILPIIVVAMEIVFIRISFNTDKGDRIPRILLLLLLLFSFVPVLGIIEAIAIPITLSIYLICNKMQIRDNRFTRYWIKM
ncbi:MAG: hypothetical protein LBF67_06040 [Prevotellaceae bacterium]|jgi:hypothetical protein|nr:hypothetical protein [Prevotellaceae bacterium]